LINPFPLPVAVTADHSASSFSLGFPASAEKPLVYFILGASGSGRHDVANELAAVASEAGGSAHVAEVVGGIWPDWPGGGVAQVFAVADGRRNPVDQVEELKPWIEAQGAELARILCVVNCQLAASTPALLPWFDACVHFSDVVLLSRREGVENRWVSDFQKRYAERFYPCLFEFVKKGQVANPLVVIEPQARRISQYFDEREGIVVEGLVIETDTPDSDGEDENEDGAAGLTDEDFYLARRAGGRRLHEIPDITKYL